MTIRFRCHCCNHRLRARADRVGRQASCKCGALVTIPAVSAHESVSKSAELKSFTILAGNAQLGASDQALHGEGNLPSYLKELTGVRLEELASDVVGREPQTLPRPEAPQLGGFGGGPVPGRFKRLCRALAAKIHTAPPLALGAATAMLLGLFGLSLVLFMRMSPPGPGPAPNRIKPDRWDELVDPIAVQPGPGKRGRCISFWTRKTASPTTSGKSCGSFCQS